MTNTWFDHLPKQVQEGKAPITEEDVWQAIADMNDLDYSEIADGDLLEWL
jgi:hypothetical protein